jgi:hypothetical protein
MVKGKQLIVSTITAVLSVLLIVGPMYIFPVCEYSKGMMIEVKHGGFVPMKCTYTAKAEIAMAAIALTIAVLLILARTSESRRLLNVVLLAVGILVIVIPLWLIGVCGGPMMPCRIGTLPFLELIGGLIIAVSVYNLVSER